MATEIAWKWKMVRRKLKQQKAVFLDQFIWSGVNSLATIAPGREKIAPGREKTYVQVSATEPHQVRIVKYFTWSMQAQYSTDQPVCYGTSQLKSRVCVNTKHLS